MAIKYTEKGGLITEPSNRLLFPLLSRIYKKITCIPPHLDHACLKVRRVVIMSGWDYRNTK